MKKRITSMFLALALCLGLATPAFADAISDDQWKANYGGAYTSGNWTYDLKDDGTAILRLSTITPSMAVDRTLTLPTELDGHKVTELGDFALAASSPLHQLGSFSKLVIPEGYTSLGLCAVSDFSLESVTLPSTLTYIGSNCFRQTWLKAVDLPASLTEMGNAAFDGCKTLESVIVRNPDLELKLFAITPSPVLSTITCLPGSMAEHYAREHGLQVQYLDGTAPVTGGGFTDVASNQYYYQPVLWAVEKEITSGTSVTTFSPDAPCTRAQIITFLWRAAGSPNYGLCDQFTDVDDDTYYAQAVAWAYTSGIIKSGSAGVTGSTFSPDTPCTRAVAVQFIWGAKDFHNYDALKDQASFTDVPEGAEYFSAVVWAVVTGVTSGTSATTFSPDTTCTRAQIVTFLYRAWGN